MRIPEPALLQVGGSNFDTVRRAAIPVTALYICAGGNLRMWIASTEMRQALLFQTAFSILFRSNTQRGHL